MTVDARRNAAEIIWRHWQAGTAIADLPQAIKPRSRAEGYAAQALLDGLSGNTRVGWKIAATSAAGQKHIAVDGPIAGRIFAARLMKPGATPTLRANRMRVVEPEIAFRMGRTLAPRKAAYSQQEVMDAVESLHLSFELPDSRFEPFTAVGGATLIADNACAHELVLGPSVGADWRGMDLSKVVIEAEVAGRYTRSGVGANALGDPRIAMTWIANELSQLDISLVAGEFVTTGTCMVPLEVVPGDRVSADYGPLGRLTLSIASDG